MKNFELTSKQQQELRAALRSARKGTAPKVGVKINTLLLLGTGWSLSEVSEALFLDEETIRKYACHYQQDGLEKVLATFYKGGHFCLNEEEINQLKDELDSKIYLITDEVCDYVERTFKAVYSRSGMTDLLKRLGFSYKKPKVKPGKAHIEMQEEFLEKFSEFMAKKSEKEAVFFMDAVHPVHNSMPAYGWMRKGKETELKSNSGRQRLNIHGAMNAETYEIIPLLSESSVNTESTLQLLKYLEELYPLATAIYVILDNARYHYSNEVKEWENNSRVKLVFIPPYSPELNLIERLWRLFKKKALYNRYYEKFNDFKEACQLFFTHQEECYDEIASLMGDGLESITVGV